MLSYKRLVIIEGNIGVGKSTLANDLSIYLGKDTKVFLEPDEKENKNPYLKRFYEDRKRYAFTMQCHLLAQRLKAYEEAQWTVLNDKAHCISDRSLWGDVSFSYCQVDDGSMTEEEFATYCSLFQIMTARILYPHFAIKLIATPKECLTRINNRLSEREGRKCESKIELSYLEKLDNEINNVLNMLEKQGTIVIPIEWNYALEDIEDRKNKIKNIASQILETTPRSGVIDLHKIHRKIL